MLSSVHQLKKLCSVGFVCRQKETCKSAPVAEKPDTAEKSVNKSTGNSTRIGAEKKQRSEKGEGGKKEKQSASIALMRWIEEKEGDGDIND